MPFYKVENNELAEAVNVDGPGFSLSETGKNGYTYPVAGWSWFANEEQARLAYSLPAAVPPPLPGSGF